MKESTYVLERQRTTPCQADIKYLMKHFTTEHFEPFIYILILKIGALYKCFWQLVNTNLDKSKWNNFNSMHTTFLQIFGTLVFFYSLCTCTNIYICIIYNLQIKLFLSTPLHLKKNPWLLNEISLTNLLTLLDKLSLTNQEKSQQNAN